MKKPRQQPALDPIQTLFPTVAFDERVRQILASMPKRHQEMLRAIYVEGKDRDQICREFQLGRDYVLALTHLAKRTFIRAYEQANQLTALEGPPEDEESPRSTSPNNARIVPPPGSFLSRLAEFLLSPKTNERLVNPIISDLQFEYCKALAAKRRVKAAWVRLRGYWSLFKAVGLYSVMKTLVEMWRKVSSI